MIGILENSAAVQIIGRDITGKWWQILYPDGPDGKGWVAMDFIRTVVTPEVPLAGPGSGGRQTATVLQKLNIRSGPGTNFNTLGIINPQEIVELTGKNATGTWLQINYPGGPDDRGWVSAAFLQLSSTSELPVLNEFGTPVATSDGEPGTAVPTPSPTIIPAPPDNDSAASPSAVITFSPLNLRLFSFTSDVSSPDGDAEDWLQFTPYANQPGQSSQLDVSLQCTGNGSLVVELWQNGSALPNWGGLNCGDQNIRLQLAGNQSYLFRLQSSSSSGSLLYVRYTLSILQLP